MKEIARGAEAVLLLDAKKGEVTKKRVRKGYRLAQIDDALRKSRTRREAKIMGKLEGIAPKLLSTDGESTLILEYIEGSLLRDVLSGNPVLAKKIGEKTGLMHDANIIHGDLTTSNMILDRKERLRMIDFGLSFVSHSVEDKAVDLHLFKEAVESKHYQAEEEIWNFFMQGYTPKNKKQILERLKAVEKRGRNKEKY